jgi:2-oxoglutarate dehydrogenase complex dehydrogenase (E1) component-like enzyme
MTTHASDPLDDYEKLAAKDFALTDLWKIREAIPALIAMVREKDTRADALAETLDTTYDRATAAEADAAAARKRVRWLRNGLEEITGVGFDAPATFAGPDAEWERKRANIMQDIARAALGRQA